MIDRASAATAGGSSTADRGKLAAGAVYILFLLTFFTAGLTAVVGAVVAYLARPGAEEWVRSHFRRQDRLFWTLVIVGLPLVVLGFIGGVLKWVLVGFPILWFTWIAWVVLGAWFLISTVRGLIRLHAGRSAKG